MVITSVESRHEFLDILKTRNPSFTVLKLGATWCAPCKKVHPHVHEFFKSMPDNVNCIDLDIDNNSDIYAWLKSKKMINGIPVIMRFDSGNCSYIPDDICTGADINALNGFFDQCKQNL